MVHVLLKPGLKNFEHYFTSVWDECSCAVVWAFFGTKKAVLSKSLIQCSADGWGCALSLQFGLRPNYGRGNGSNGDVLEKHLCQHTLAFQTDPDPTAGHCHPHLGRRLPDTHRQIWLSLCGVTVPFSWVLVHTVFCCALQKSVSPVLWEFCNQIPLAFKVKFPGGSDSLCWIPRLGNLSWTLELFQQCKNFFGIIVLQFLGRLLSRSIVELMTKSSKRT